MNNRNWVAVFLGLACLVLFVSVMGASGNWLNNNNGENNNGMNPQQVTQTVRDMNKNSTPSQDTPTKIDANGLTDNITDTLTGRDGSVNTNDTNNNNTNTANGNNNKNMLDIPQVNMPQMKP